MNVPAWQPHHVPAAAVAPAPAAQLPPHLPTDPVVPAPAAHDPAVLASSSTPLAPITPANELLDLDKIKQLEGEVESLKKAKVDLEGEIESLRKDKDEMKDPLGVLKAKVDDNLSYYDTEFKILYGKVAALERAPAHE